MNSKSKKYYDRCDERCDYGENNCNCHDRYDDDYNYNCCKCSDKCSKDYDCGCKKDYDNYEDDYKDHKCCNQGYCNPGHPLPTCSLFACGQGTGVAIPIPSALNPTFNPIPLASVTIDTTCLCNPSVKIDFNSLINYQALISIAGTLTTPFTVTFQLSKTCNSGSKIALGTWDYSYGTVALATNITNSFNFTHCECNVCPGCCVYTVEIIRVTGSLLAAAGLTITENASIRSSNISATAISH
ncbi:DUF4489 domain-containing protein [Clostridium ihumii]|uniref:DUF4489 domain-containing protein n=1 Tax=Clostridium ihumii TaxID=1470356 RepID=UPI003D357B51